MKRRVPAGAQLVDTLRTVALAYPEAEEGVACAGTAAERVTVTL